MLRVVILLECFSVGGAQNMVYNLVKKLDRTKIDPVVLCYRERVYTELEKEVMNCCTVEYLNIRGHLLPHHYVAIINSIKRYSPDIVHGHLSAQMFAILYCTVFRKPCVITAHTKPEKAFEKRTEWLLRRLVRKKLGCIVAVSQENKLLCDNYFKDSVGNCVFINNGVDVDKFYRKPHNHFTFINVSRQDENKNQIAILRCFRDILKYYPCTQLYLLGDGPCHDQLTNEMKTMGLGNNVHIPGNIFNVEDYYAISDVYVQSSHREAMPLSALEAMAAGLPIISTDVGGMRDIVTSNGLLVKDGDDIAFLEAMKKYLLMSDDDLKMQSEQSLKNVSGYSASFMAKEYEKLYESIICEV